MNQFGTWIPDYVRFSTSNIDSVPLCDYDHRLLSRNECYGS
jgi:hypothetical protein